MGACHIHMVHLAAQHVHLNIPLLKHFYCCHLASHAETILQIRGHILLLSYLRLLRHPYLSTAMQIHVHTIEHF